MFRSDPVVSRVTGPGDPRADVASAPALSRTGAFRRAQMPSAIAPAAPTPTITHGHLTRQRPRAWSGGRGWPIGHARRGDEPVAPPRHRLDKAGRVGRVAQRVAQPFHRGVQSVFEVDEGIIGPEALAEFFARDKLARLFEQHREQLQRLLLKAETCARLSQLARAQIEFEDAKPDEPMCRCRGFEHGNRQPSQRRRQCSTGPRTFPEVDVERRSEDPRRESRARLAQRTRLSASRYVPGAGIVA